MTEEIKYVLANTLPSIPDQRDIPYRSPYKPEDLPGSVDMREDVYEIENQRQILQAIDTIKNELNFSFQNELKEEQDTYNYFLS